MADNRLDNGGGSSDTDSLASRFVNGVTVDWRGIIATVIKGSMLMWAGLLATFYSGMFSGMEHVFTTIVDQAVRVPVHHLGNVIDLIGQSFDVSAASLQSEFGVFAFVAGVAVVAMWFVAMESIVAFARGYLQG